MQAPSLRTLVALGIVTASTLMLQVVVTRLFSEVLAYHFSFLAISLAMLGVGAGSLLIYVRPAWFEGVRVEVLLSRWSAIFAGLLVLVPLVLVRLDLGSEKSIDPSFIANLALACVVTALPSLASGVVVALMIDRYTEWIGRVYAYDLVGAGLGALVVVPVLGLGPAPVLLVALGMLVAIAAVLFVPTGERSGPALGVAGLAAVVLAVSLATPVVQLGGNPPNVRLYADRWTPLARVLGMHAEGNKRFAAVVYDRVYAPVPIVDESKLPGWRELVTGPQSIGYEITGPGKALVVGGGGGRDIYTALSLGQRPIHVIELNEGIVGVVDGSLGELSHAPYSRDGVTTTVGDGRSVLARSQERYDQIHLGFTDTLSANAAQGYALTENNLYTVEAFDLYFDRLAPGGILNVSRLLKLVGDEAIRVTVLTLAALEQRGIENPGEHIVVVLGRDILGPPFATVLARLEPFTRAEIEKIQALAESRGAGTAWLPGGPYAGVWKDLAEATSLEAFVAGYPLEISPPTDDKPFFFNMHRWGQLLSVGSGYHYARSPFLLLMVTLAILAALSLVAFVVPLGITTHSQRPGLGSLTYFAAIGLGFMLLEVVLVQRFVLFLGFPTYALSVVLAALLVSSGVGSWISSRFRDTKRGLTRALTLALVLIACSALGLQPLLRALIELPFAVRLVVAFVVLMPVGLVLGMAMPVGLRRFQALYPTGIAYAWGVNGVASVLASVLGVAIAVNFGFPAASFVALACYGFALLHVVRGEWA
ncbi:MAG: hypothetical protein VCC20_06860 [Myxococcota bacterium]